MPLTPRPLRSRRLRAVLLAAAAASVVAAALPAPVPLGIGDPLFPHLGNPGYDVLSYDIGLTYLGDNNKPMEAVTTIDAVATDGLDRINLDFARGTVHGGRGQRARRPSSPAPTRTWWSPRSSPVDAG